MKLIHETINYKFFQAKVDGLSGEVFFKQRKPNELCGEMVNKFETLTTCEFELITTLKP